MMQCFVWFARFQQADLFERKECEEFVAIQGPQLQADISYQDLIKGGWCP